jgi:hypothetical protein
MTADEIFQPLQSFLAVGKPVLLTMILASLAVVYIHEPNDGSTPDAEVGSAFLVYEEPSGDGGGDGGGESAGTKLGHSMVNALMYIAVIIIATFVIVFAYWMNFMRCIMGYMLFSSSMLLGAMGGGFFLSGCDPDVANACEREWFWGMASKAIQLYHIDIDQATYFIVLWNWAVVG